MPWTCAGGAANYLRSSSRSFKIANRTRAKKYISQSVTMRGNRVSPPKKYEKYGTQNRRPAPRLCKYCGGKHARDKSKCPAYGEICLKCKKMKHYERVCKQISKPLGEHNVNKLNGRDNKEDYGEEEYYKENYSEEDSAEYTFRLAHELRAVKDKGTQWFVTLKMKANHHSRDVKCQIDMRTMCNITNYLTYCKISQDGDARLCNSSAKLCLYDGTTMLPLGQTTVDCTFCDRTYPLCFQIVETNQSPLLSAKASQRLGLVTLHVSESMNNISKVPQSSVEPLTRERILTEYKDVFEGLSCLAGELHFEVDKSVAPVQHQPRKVAVSPKRELKEKIDQHTKCGVLAKVTKHTPWISSMVAVKKPGKLQICLNPKDLNVALERSNYPLPTIEEIFPRLAKAKVFSVLDAKDGFWQIKLDEESSYVTTFWTPFGRYRWLRMPFRISSAPEEYQRRQHELLEGLHVSGIECIVDDILVYGCGETIEQAIEDHDKNLISLLSCARESNLKLNKDKL